MQIEQTMYIIKEVFLFVATIIGCWRIGVWIGDRAMDVLYGKETKEKIMGLDAYPKLVVGVRLEDIASTKDKIVENTYYHEKTGKPYKKSERKTLVVFNGQELNWRQFFDALKIQKQKDDDDEEAEDGNVPYVYYPEDDNDGDGFTIHRTHSEGDWLNGFLGYCMGRGDGGVERIGGQITVDLKQADLFLKEAERRLKEIGVTVEPSVYAFVYASY